MANSTTLDDLYYTDPTIISARAREICAYLCRLCLRNDYSEGKAYVADLPDDDLSELVVAVQAVTVYVQDGDYKGARDFLDRIHLDRLLEPEHALLDENVAALALFSAWVDCASHLRITEGLALVDEVDNIYMTREWNLESDFQEAQTRNRAEMIIRQRQLWDLSSNAYDNSVIISDARAALEDIPMHIMWRAIDSAMVKRECFHDRLLKRYPPLLRYLSENNRTLTHAGVMYVWLPSLSASVSTSTAWQDYLGKLSESEVCLIKAAVLSSLVYYSGANNAPAAQEYFEQAAKIYAEQDCPAHNACLMLNHWRTRATEPDDELLAAVKDQLQITDTDHTQLAELVTRGRGLVYETHAKQRMSSLLAIHKALVACACTLGQVNCVIEAIEHATKNPSLWDRVQQFLAPTLQQLTKKEDTWHAQLIQFRYYLPTSEIYDRAEEARAFFERILATRESAEVPDLYFSACKGMWRACSKMGDHETALKYAIKDLDHPSPVENEARRSQAAERLVLSKVRVISDKLPPDVLEEETARVLPDLEALVTLLETWIGLDQAAGRAGDMKQKNKILRDVLVILTDKLRLEQYRERHRVQAVAVLEQNSSEQLSLSIVPMMLAVSQSRWPEVLKMSEELHERVTSNNKFSTDEVNGIITAVVAAFHASAALGGHLSEKTRKELLLRQYDLIMSDLQALHLTLSEIYLLRAVPIMWTLVECVKTWPERRNEFVLKAAVYFMQAHEMCLNITRRITAQLGIHQWLRKRDLGSQFHFSHICQIAAEFFLKSGIYQIAWTWIQIGRAPALRDMLHERTTARRRLLVSLERKPEVITALAEEKRLLQAVQHASPSEYFDAARNLEQHRSNMRSLPALQSIIDPPLRPGTILIQDVQDIWDLKKYLPEETGIVLVDWFIDTRSVIWRLDVSFAGKDNGPRWTRGYINLDKIQQWKREFLNFPLGGLFALEYRMKALHQLRALLTGLDVMSKPGDLLIISTPGELSTIPIHGIPFEGRTLIERNPVLYTGGLDLFRQCLKRAKDRAPASLLNAACFASAYEQEGHEAERAAIFSHLQDTADDFGSTALLGDGLTVDGMQHALSTASWIHYHGHAYYAKTEALNQCLVLGRLSQEERQAQARLGNAQERLAKAMPFEARLSEQDAMLSSHLLEGNSRLTVADIFAMDLSTSPVVINIACDSGVQDFSLGNDPLGLVAALFCAGASSIVGTLWPIRSATGRAFSKAFYESIAAQNKGTISAERSVNIAFAFRDAVLAIKKTRRDPYSWAAFTLQGAPLYFYRSQAEAV